MTDKEEKKMTVEELLCLQLLGYSSKQIHGDIQTDGFLMTMISKSIHELDKARRILDSQAKAGVFTIPYYDEAYPHHFRYLCDDTQPLIHVWAMWNCSTVRTMWLLLAHARQTRRGWIWLMDLPNR